MRLIGGLLKRHYRNKHYWGNNETGRKTLPKISQESLQIMRPFDISKLLLILFSSKIKIIFINELTVYASIKLHHFFTFY